MKNSSYLQRFDGVELAVRERGEGIPLVWGHSLLGSIRVDDLASIWHWEKIEHYARLARYDARGHGNSDGSYNPADYRWDHLAEDMLRVAEAVAGGQRYILGGASMGCATALEAALHKPEAVAGLILALPPTAWRERRAQAHRYRRQAWLSGLFGATPYRLLDWLPGRDSDDARQRLALTITRELAQANPFHVQAALRGAAMSDLPQPEALSGLTMPVLIIAWEDDPIHPVSTAHMLAETLPDVRGLIVSTAEDTACWTAAVCDFLREVRAGAQARARNQTRRSAARC